MGQNHGDETGTPRPEQPKERGPAPGQPDAPDAADAPDAPRAPAANSAPDALEGEAATRQAGVGPEVTAAKGGDPDTDAAPNTGARPESEPERLTAGSTDGAAPTAGTVPAPREKDGTPAYGTAHGATRPKRRSPETVLLGKKSGRRSADSARIEGAHEPRSDAVDTDDAAAPEGDSPARTGESSASQPATSRDALASNPSQSSGPPPGNSADAGPTSNDTSNDVSAAGNPTPTPDTAKRLPRLLSTETPGPLARPGSAQETDDRELLSDRYRLDSVVGRGGMGTVWRATDEMLGRTVAVKELRLPSNVDDVERQRLVTRTLREAKAIAAIRSKGVVTIYDVIDDGTRPWIVMELIEGRALSDIVRTESTLDAVRVAEIGLEILDVLAAAHRAGIVHRDVKPSNVLIGHTDGRVVLTDFGIAKVEGDSSITSTGMLVGAPSYISPERARGGGVGPAADFWSLGGLLFCALVGHPPHDQGGAIATLTSVMHDTIEIPEATGPLAGVIAGLLRKDPAARFNEETTRAMLRQVVDGSTTGEPEDADGPAGEPTTMVFGADTAGPAAPAAPAASEAPTPPATPAVEADSAAGPAVLPPTPPQPHPAVRTGGDTGHGAGLGEDSDATPIRPTPVPPGEFGPPTPPAGRQAVTATDGRAGDPGGGATTVAGGGGRRRRTALLAALGAAVLVAAVVLAVPQFTGGDGEPGPDRDGNSEPSAETTDGPEEDGTDDGADEDGTDGGADDGNGGESSPDPGETSEEDPDGTDDPEPTGPPGVEPDRDDDSSFPPESPEGISHQVSTERWWGMALWGGVLENGTASVGSLTVHTAPSGGPSSVRGYFRT